MTHSSLVPAFRDTARAYSALRIPKMGAALAYYTAISLAPLVVLVLSLAEFLVHKDYARHELLNQVQSLLGDKGVAAIKDILEHTQSLAALSWQTFFSFVILLVTASGAFGEMQDSLDQIYMLSPPANPIRNFIKGRLLSFAMIFVLGFFSLASLLLSAFLSGFSRALSSAVPLFGAEIFNTLLSVVVVTVLFSLIYRLLPMGTLRWKQIWPGALLSSCLFSLGKFLLGWYLGKASFASSYGAAGSFLIVLVWVFYSSQLLFLGAAFNHALSRRSESPQANRTSVMA